MKGSLNAVELDEALWAALASEGRFELIERLRKALLRMPGYGTIVVTREGFSESDRTHNLVIRWLKAHRIHTMNVIYEVEHLKMAAASFRKGRRKQVV